MPAAPVEGEYQAPDPAARARTYRLPDLALFDPPARQVVDETNRAHVLEDTLASFGVGAKVMHIERGPSITRYELRPERGVKISRIASLADDLALALAATSVRIEAPIPGKSAVGIEVPNANVSVVAIREILEALPNRGQIPPLWMALGKDITGRPVFGDLGKMPHLLVAGATGSGKSVCLNTIVASLLVAATPDQVQILMIDPKRVELTVYNGIPHLIKEVITDPKVAAGALLEMTREMDARYERFAKAGVRKIEEYNAKYPDERLPFVVIIIDELADLMLVAPSRVETTIMRLAQLARATGIHLIVATQRPSVDVITGLIKANIPSRIAFAVSSQVDSRTILDQAGAERLLGRGDMLFLPIDAPKPMRAQGALISGPEVT
ncbi:MAG: DNA translocase FtsK, partial [Candidatus Eremiobacteraeota bacterium]|nr:DNA translocase FtsK [Candidatus Eremiobacteraeota bacterium]